MQLDLSANGYLFHGISQAVNTEKGLWLLRHDEELLKFYSYNEHIRIRTLSSAGVRISMKTNSPFIRFRFKLGCWCRPFYKFTLMTDNSARTVFGPDEYQEDVEFTAQLPADSKMHSAMLYLPNMCETFCKSIELADGAFFEPVPESANRILFIGDSITQGMTAPEPDKSYANMYADAMKCDALNIAVGGAMMAGELGKLALNLKWKTAFIAFGVNDFNHAVPIDDFMKNTRTLLSDISQKRGVSLNIITPIPWAARTEPNAIGLHLADYREAIRKTASEFSNVRLIDGCRLVADDPALFVDNIHPNTKGMETYACNLILTCSH